MKHKIFQTRSEENLYAFWIENKPTVHGAICNTLHSMQFSDESVGEFDIPLETLNEEYILAKDDAQEAEAFITTNTVVLVVRTKQEQHVVYKTMSMFFNTPYEK